MIASSVGSKLLTSSEVELMETGCGGWAGAETAASDFLGS